MNNYYILKHRFINNEIKIESLPSLRHGCKKSEFQYLDHKEIVVDINSDDGYVFPDFLLVENFIPLISNQLRGIFEEEGIDNIFYKSIIVRDKLAGKSEQYWLALPPRIDCVDVEDENNNFGFDFYVKIIPERVGNYRIFKIKEVGNNEIIIVESLYKRLSEEVEDGLLKGVKFTKLENEVK